MIKTFFYLKTDKKNSNGESPIYAKIKLQNESITLSSGKFISKKRWEETNKLRSLLRIKTEKTSRIAIDSLKNKIDSIYYELYSINPDTKLIDVKNKLKGISTGVNDIDIIKLFKKHNDYFKKKTLNGERSKDTLQKYNRAKDLLSTFIKSKYKKTSFNVTDINNKFIYDLEHYLKYDSIFKNKKGIGHNSVIKYFQCFKTVCNFSIKRSLITKNPFVVYDEKLIIKEATFLSEAELRIIENKKFDTDRLSKVRDIFIFSCYTGYAPIDIQKLTRKNLIQDGNNSLWIKTNRTKTKVKSNVPVLAPVKRIIDKYSTPNNESILPSISNQKMNKYLKEIAQHCNIDKNLTHYVARHTFATTVTLGNQISIENVSSMMGHTRITMTQHYAKVLDSNVKKDMDKLSNKFQ